MANIIFGNDPEIEYNLNRQYEDSISFMDFDTSSFEISNDNFILLDYYPKKRFNIFLLLKELSPDIRISFPNCISEKSTICCDLQSDSGIIIGDNVYIGPNCVIGSFCKISAGAQIHHHSEIGNFCTVSPGAILLGHTKVGKMSIIGASSVIRQFVEIGESCYIGMGSVVVKSVKYNNVVAFGNPSKIIRDND